MKLNFIPAIMLGVGLLTVGSVIGQAPDIRLKNPNLLPDKNIQATMRLDDSWQSFIKDNGEWMVIFNEETAFPQRAFGKPIPVSGNTLVEKAYDFMHNHMGELNFPLEEMVVSGAPYSDKKHDYVYFYQVHNGMTVENSHFLVKMDKQGRVISFGGDVYAGIELDNKKALLGSVAAKTGAAEGIYNVLKVEVNPEIGILPIKKANREVEFKQVYKVMVSNMEDNQVPGEYYTLVDAATGKVVTRQNQVQFCENGDHNHGVENKSEKEQYAKKAAAAGFSLTGTGYRDNPTIAEEVLPMQNAYLSIDGMAYKADANGVFSDVPITGPTTAKFFLQGDYVTVKNSLENDAVAVFETTIDPSTTTVSMDDASLREERCAYYNVNVIHDYMKSVLPNFTGMDNQLVANVQITPGECNAFYNGSLNFYVAQATCVSYALVADVVYHEYGHGINRLFYSAISPSAGGPFNFQNGGMNEGYADVWAMAALEDPILGNGGDPTNPEGFIRRYDIDPKVFPKDLVGEVHADGEIIAGAWWDLYLNLGNDMSKMMELFALAYPGAQAIYGNGDEGKAFTNVLIDVLQADDDDGDISNGTPNGVAIADAFRKHGITLLSNATVAHTNVPKYDAGVNVSIEARLTLESTLYDYLKSVSLYYAGSDANVYTQVAMNEMGGNNYEYTIAGLPNGTLLKYYIAVEDNFGNVTSVTPLSANESDPNVPYFSLIGFSQIDLDDFDGNDGNLGDWLEGDVDDNATTGRWEYARPIGSYGTAGDPNTIAAPATQTTPGGENCYVTENSLSPTAGIGEKDVDGGKTTLFSPEMDMSSYTNPVLTYQRWYINNPATGANPGADWWQVAISNNGQDWVYVENTKQSNKVWRKYAFRVRDYVELSDQVQLRFVASDSIRPGQNLEGGSLIEAGVDDLILYEAEAFPNSVTNLAGADFAVQLYPNPVKDVIVVRSENEFTEMSITLFDQTGRQVMNGNMKMDFGVGKWDVSQLPAGIYAVELKTGNRISNQKIVVQ